MSFESNEHTLPLNDFYTLYNDYVNRYNIYSIFKFFFSHIDDYFSLLFINKIYSRILINLLCKSNIKITDMIRDYAKNDENTVRSLFIKQHLIIIDFIMKHNYPSFQDIFKVSNTRRIQNVISDCLYYQNEKTKINKIYIYDDLKFVKNLNCTCDLHLINKYTTMDNNVTKIPEYYANHSIDICLFMKEGCTPPSPFNNNFLEGCNDLFKNIYDIYDTFITYLKEYIPVVVINELRTKLKQYKEGPCLNYFIYEISSTIDKYDYLINTTNVLCVHNKHLKKALVKARSMDRIIHNTLEEDILTIERLIYTFVNNRPLIIWTPNLSHHNTFFDIIRRECDNKKFRAKVIKTFNSDIYPKL
jgi:hypothetical protein